MTSEYESPAMRFTRREFLRRSSVLMAATLGVGPTVLAACGGDGGAGIAGTTINFFSWQGYDLLDVPAMKKWRKAHDVRIDSTYVSSHNEITAKFTTGGGTGVYDLSTYEAGYGPFYQNLDFLQPVDVSKVPNFQDVYPLFRKGNVASRWWHFGGKQWGFPFTWGLQGINYDSSKIERPPNYKDLMDPSLKEKIGITDDVVAAIVIGAAVIGVFRVDSLYTPDQLNRIIEFWQEMKKNARSIIPSFGDMADQFVAGEIVAATPGWAAVNKFAAQKGMTTVKHVAPKEGSTTFCDTYFIPQDAADVEAVYAFINEGLSPKAQAQTAEVLVQGIVNPKAVPLMDPETRALYPYDQIESILTKTAPLEALPVKAPDGYADFADWNNAWERFKAA
jgi:spermidine/putrescine transport system substrate-binding protein